MLQRCPAPRDKLIGHRAFREAMKDRLWIGALAPNVKLCMKLIESYVYGREHEEFVKDLVIQGKTAGEVLAMEEFEAYSGAFGTEPMETHDSTGESGLSIESGLEADEVLALKALKGNDKAIVAKADAEAERIVSEHVQLIDGSMPRPLRRAKFEFEE